MYIKSSGNWHTLILWLKKKRFEREKCENYEFYLKIKIFVPLETRKNSSALKWLWISEVAFQRTASEGLKLFFVKKYFL